MEWISVKDRLPKEGQRCIIIGDKEDYFFSEYKYRSWCYINYPYCIMCKVTHWMPLEPPENNHE